MPISNRKCEALGQHIARELSKGETIGVYVVVFKQKGRTIEADGRLIADPPNDLKLLELTKQMEGRLNQIDKS